jgi:hypothetical protein
VRTGQTLQWRGEEEWGDTTNNAFGAQTHNTTGKNSACVGGIYVTAYSCFVFYCSQDVTHLQHSYINPHVRLAICSHSHHQCDCNR